MKKLLTALLCLALLTAPMLGITGIAISEDDLELDVQEEYGEIELEIDPGAEKAGILEDALDLDGGLELDGISVALYGAGESQLEGIEVRANTLAQSNTTDDSDFVIRDDGVLTGYTGPGGDVTIPGSVTSIGMDAFYQCTSLTSVTIPGSVALPLLRPFGLHSHTSCIIWAIMHFETHSKGRLFVDRE